MVKSSVSDQGSPGQVFALKNGDFSNPSNSVETPIPVANFQRVYGYALYPCIEYTVRKGFIFDDTEDFWKKKYYRYMLTVEVLR